ncbi:MAG: arylsulfatase [bacterium]|nr:arylsulfatase [bacterium]
MCIDSVKARHPSAGRLAITFLCSLFLSWNVALAAAGPSLQGARPNIVLVMTDDQGFAPVGAHGHPWIQTPNLDRFHHASTRFTRFLVSPTCSPTRSAIMTGRHPMKNGVTHTILERERMTLQATTLPQILQTVGYKTAIFGKWHLGDEEPYQPQNRGFDESFIHGAGGIGQAYNCSCADAPNNKYFNPVIRHNGRFVKTNGYCTDLFFTAALGWIDQQRQAERPFFAYIATNAPHGPFIAPPANTAKFENLGFSSQTAGFYGMIENIDENFGVLIDRLEQWGLLENTLIIFMSDNGMTGGGSGKQDQPLVNGYPFYNAGMKGLKGSTDEGGVRVPFFIRWDGKIQAAQDVDRIAAHIDILPTLAALAGAELPPGQVEGRNLLPLIEGSATSDWPDRYLFTHKGRWKTGEDPDSNQWINFAVRNQRFRYVGQGTLKMAEGERRGAGALYDMLADPGQTTDVLHQHPQVAEEMRVAYEQFWKEARPLMVNEDAPMSPTRPFHVWYEEQLAAEGIPDWEPPEIKNLSESH